MRERVLTQYGKVNNSIGSDSSRKGVVYDGRT